MFFVLAMPLALVPGAAAFQITHAGPAPSQSRVVMDRGGSPVAQAARYPRREMTLGALTAFSLAPMTSAAAAQALAQLVDSEFRYRLILPSDWNPDGKPLKTHLHERLISSPSSTSRAKVGISVDPVKVDSLEAFGTADQTAERVIGVEKGRDGVKTVTLREVSVESGTSGSATAGDAGVGDGGEPTPARPTYYTIEYATVSSRGTKLFRCKYCITRGLLYVLQAQANLDAFEADRSVRDEIRGIVASFEVAPPS